MADAIKGFSRARLLYVPSNGHGIAQAYIRLALAPTGKPENPSKVTYLHNHPVVFCGMDQGLTG